MLMISEMVEQALLLGLVELRELFMSTSRPMKMHVLVFVSALVSRSCIGGDLQWKMDIVFLYLVQLTVSQQELLQRPLDFGETCGVKQIGLSYFWKT